MGIYYNGSLNRTLVSKITNRPSRPIVARYPIPVAKNDKQGVILMTEVSILNDGTEDVTGDLL